MEGTCLIISGGAFSGIPEAYRDCTYVIACDRGWQYAEKLGIKPDLIIGDFDSAPEPETDVPVEKVPAEKDDTDTMLAARKALELGFKNVVIACAFGGRLDHALANIQTGMFLSSQGADTVLLGKDTDALIFKDGIKSIPKKEGWSLSVFSLTDTSSGVTIRGTKYECTDEILTNTFPIGVSNVWEAENALISVSSGSLMVLCSRLKKGEHI
ncbi:MAG: thiamine diphosphokinase [Lachnospiraceae bacterium]|nr:thiamine diphosphokinase [Lachnospiraceae bacterium]